MEWHAAQGHTGVAPHGMASHAVRGCMQHVYKIMYGMHGTMLHEETLHGMVWHGMAWCGMVWRGMTWCGMAWRGMTWHGGMLHEAMVHDMACHLRACSMELHAERHARCYAARRDMQQAIAPFDVAVLLAWLVCMV
eukprot:366363-Chlamydomonas_euryale.AAC.2